MNKYSISIILMCLFCVSRAQTTFTVTNTNDSGAGSLRQAILDAEASAGADIIDMTGITGAITLASGLPNIAEDVTINGAGSASTVIDGNGLYRPFFIGGAGVNDTDAPVVVINNLTIQNGVAEGESPQGNAGGGAGMGGAIFINDGDVTLSNVHLTGNIAHGGNGGSNHFGGGFDGGDGPFPNTGGVEAPVPSPFVGGPGGYGAGGGGGVYNFNFGGANGGPGGYGAGGGGGGGHDQAPGNGGSAGSFGGSGATANSLGSAGGGGGAGLGGAIYVRNGLLIIENSSLTSNTALRGLGGNPPNDPSGGNGQGKGGAVFNHAGTVYTDNVTLTGNTATSAGSASTDNNDHYGQNEARLTTAITTQPTNLSSNEGDDPSFTVVSEGNDLTYQWQVDDGNGFADVTDGGIYSGATTATLDLTCVTDALDGYNYRVEISGFVNDVTSDAATLNVLVVPITVTISGPSETTCSQGEELTFTATPANVYETPAFRWFVDGNEVQGETGSTLTRTSSAEDVITAEVSDPSACFARTPGISDGFTITMGTSPDPEVTITLNATEICETTDMASFTATPTLGGTNPTYSWSVDGEFWGGGATRDVGGFADGSIVQVVMTSNDPCLTGATTATATYTVQFADGPPITQQPQDATAEILGAASASYSVAATGTGLTYQWQYNRVGGVYEDFTDGNIRNGELTAAGSTTPTLSLTSIVNTDWHNTQVRCIVSEGDCGTFSDEADVLFTGGTYIVQNNNASGAGSLLEGIQTSNNLSFSRNGVPTGPTIIDLTQRTGTIEIEAQMAFTGSATLNGPGAGNLTIGWSTSTGAFGGAIFNVYSFISDVEINISGLTLDGANNPLSYDTGLDLRGTGSSSYVINNCVFSNFDGYHSLHTASINVDNVQFTDHGLSLFGLTGSSQIANSTFTNVPQDGIYINGAANLLINNVEVTNAGQDGVEVRGAENLLVSNSKFHGNSEEGFYIQAAGGSGQFQFDNVKLYNNGDNGMWARFHTTNGNLIIKNSSAYDNTDSGIHLRDGFVNATVNRSTFSDNGDYGVLLEGEVNATLNNITSTGNRNGIIDDSGTAVVELNNSIVLGNSQGDFYATPSSTLGHNIYEPNSGTEQITGITTGNRLDLAVTSVLDAAQTVNDARYYPLLACTPVINAGAPSGASAMDQIGNALVGTSDPGAIEFQSAPVPLNVSVAINQITVDPCPGDLIEMAAVPMNGGENPSYRWLKDGVHLSTNSSIVVFVGTDDNYQLEMTTSEGCLVDQQVVTHDFVPDFDNLATITQQPVSLTTQTGQNANFSVTATGAAVTYQWQVSTNGGTSYTDLTDGGQISGATTNSLTISSTTVNEAENMYRVKVIESGVCAIISDEVTLTLNVVLVVNSLLDNEIADADLTLREAFNTVISEAGNDLFTAENPIIIDATGLSGTIELLTALPTATWYVKIEGPSDQSLSITRGSGAADFGIFNFLNSNGQTVKTTLENLVIQGGAATGNGGAVNTTGDLEVINCVISGNTATGGGGGLYLNGVTGSFVTIVDSRISGNTSTGQFNNGGGINVFRGTHLTLENTLIDGNSAEFHGGGLYAGNGGTVEIFNSTFSGNSVSSTNTGRGGGAVHLDLRYNNKIISSTFVGNASASPTLSFNTNFFGTFVNQILENSIVVGNTGQSSGFIYDYNLIGDNLLMGSGNIMDGPDATTNNLSLEFGSNNLYEVTAANVVNLTLQDNGGPTLTHALVDCSPAINFIANPSANTPATDATGASRVDETDAGAVEFVGTPTVITDHPEDVTINKTEQAVFAATATSPGTLNHQWQVNTGSGFSDITDDTNYSGSQTATLTIDNVPESFDGHTYRLNISGTCDNSSDEATLRVENPVPVFSSIPITEASEGVDYFFMADVTDPQGDFLALANSGPSWITTRISMLTGPHFSVTDPTMAPLTFVEAAAPNDGSNRIYSISGTLINSVTITGQDPKQFDISSLNPVASFSPGEITMLNSDELYFAFQYGEDGSSNPLFRIVKFDPTEASPVYNTIKDVGEIEDMKVHPDGVVILEKINGLQNISLISDAGVVTTISTGLSGIPAIDVTPSGKIYYLSEVFGTPTLVSIVELQMNGTTSSTQVLNGEDVYQAMDLIVDDLGRASIRWWKTDMSANLFETVSSYNGIEFEATQDVNSETITGFTRFGLDNAFFISNSGTTSNFMLYADGPVLIGTPSLSDISGNNDVSISANDGSNIVRQEFTIDIAFDNDPPTGINISGNTIDENNATGSSLLTFTTDDPNIAFDVFTYELVAGTGDDHNGEFTIVNDGLQANQSYDFEASPGTKSILVRSTDLGGETVEETFTITISDINESPTAIALSGNMEVVENLPVGTVIGTITTTDEDAGDSHTYMVSGTDATLFTAVGNELQTTEVLDYEEATSRTITITTTDGAGLTFDEDFTITIIDDTPTDITLSNSSVDEGLLPGAVVGTLSTVDADPNNTFTYAFVTGLNFNAFFELDGNILTTKGIFNASQFTSVTIRVSTTDEIGESFEKDLVITINDLTNSAPQLLGEPTATTTQGELYTYAPGIYDFDGDQVNVTSTTPSWLTQVDQEASVEEFLAENGADNLEIDDDDNLYVTIQDANGNTTNILKYDDATESTSTLLSSDATSISFVDVDENGVIYFSDNNFNSSSWRVRKIENGTVSDVYFATGDISHGGYHSDEHLVLVETQSDNTKDIIKIDLDGTNKTALEEEVGFVGVFEIGADDNIHYATTNTMMAIDIDGDAATSLQPELTTDNQTSPYLYYISDYVQYSSTEAFIMYADNDNAGGSLDYLVKVTSRGEQLLWTGDVIYEGGKIAANASSEVFFTRDADSNSNRSVAKWNQAFTFFFGTPEDSDVGTSDFDFTLSDDELSNDYSFTIEVQNVNDAPTDISLSGTSIDENNDTGISLLTISSEDPDNDEGDTQTYVLVSGDGDDDNSEFEIAGSDLRALVSFDHEVGETKSIRIEATDASGATYSESLEISISDLNETPTAIELSSTSINENEDAGTVIGTLSTQDPDETNDNLVFEIIEGAEFVQLSGAELQAATSFDFETTPSFTVSIRANDGVENSSTFFTIEESFTITVVDVSESPSDIALSNATIDENAAAGTAVGTLTAQDPDGSNSNTFSLVDGSEDNALFDVSGDELITASVFDFESENTFTVEVQVDDGGGNTFSDILTISINDINEAPVFSTASTAGVAENTTAVVTLTASDEDTGAELTYSIVDGADQSLFSLDGGMLSFAAEPDFESPTDGDSDNIYFITVRVSDGALNDDLNLEVTVTDVNEAPTLGISNNLTVEERTEDPISLIATDPDSGAELTYSLLSGNDVQAFDLTGNELTFLAVPDFESPADSDSDNIYEFTLRVSDGTNHVDTDFTITVTDVNEAPIFGTVTDYTLEENTSESIDLSASDADANELTYSITGGSDHDLFQLNGANLSFVNSPDFETPFDVDGDNVYELTIQVSDGTNSVDADFTITVSDVNEAPIFGSTALSFVENHTGPVSVTATDQDADAELIYTITGGIDQDAFSISDTEVSFINTPDFESPADADGDNVYEFSVRVSDGTNVADADFTITVTDQNEAPVFGTVTAYTVEENTSETITFSASDTDADASLTYAIIGGADQLAFDLSGTDLTFVNTPDFEAPADSDGDNVYVFNLQVSDGTNEVEAEITVTVTGVNEAPNAISIDEGSVDENVAVGTVVGTLSSTDPDATFTHTYSVAATEANFGISEGQLITNAIFDFEDQETYSVAITATDEGGLSFEQILTIAINDIIENKPNSSIEIDAIQDMDIGTAAFELSAVTNPENADVIWSVVEGDASISGTTLTPGNQAGTVVIRAVIEETDEYNASEDIARFNLLDPTLIDPSVVITVPQEVTEIETVTVQVSLDAMGATTISESDIVLSVESGPGTLNGNELTFSGAGKVVVVASLAGTSATNAATATAEIDVIAVFDISGRALDADGIGFVNGGAFLVATDNFNESLSVALGTDGTFSFQNVKEGDYYLGIGVPQTETIYLTTYLGDKSPILDPTTIPDVVKLSADVSGLVINMQSKPAPAVDLIDPATGGTIEFQAQGANDGQNRIILGRVEMGDPIPNTQVVLSTIDGDYVADGLTDENGFITFEGLPTGDYRIGVEIPGVGRVETEIPVEEGEQADVTGLISEDGTVALEVEEVLGVNAEAHTTFNLFPNPVKEQLNVQFENEYYGPLSIEVFDLNGRRVHQSIDEKKSFQFYLEQEIDLPEGTYLILIKGEDISIQKRFIKL